MKAYRTSSDFAVFDKQDGTQPISFKNNVVFQISETATHVLVSAIGKSYSFRVEKGQLLDGNDDTVLANETKSYLEQVVKSTEGGGIGEAPINGKFYGRKDGGWSEITVTPDDPVTNDLDLRIQANYDQYKNTTIEMLPPNGSILDVIFPDMRLSWVNDGDDFRIKNLNTSNGVVDLFTARHFDGSLPNQTFQGTGTTLRINPVDEEFIEKGVSDTIWSRLVNIIPTVSDPCFLNPDGKEIISIESIDELEGVTIDLRFNSVNTDKFGGNPILLASRISVIESISTFTGITEGVNNKQFTFTSVDVESLRSGTGAITFRLHDGFNEFNLGCINIKPKTNELSLSSSMVLSSLEDFNDLSDTSGVGHYEAFNHNRISLSGTTVISLGKTNIPLNILFKISGSDVSFAAVSPVTLDGKEFPSDGDLILLRGTGISLDLIKVGNVND